MRTFKAASKDRIATALRRIASSIESGELHPQDAVFRTHRVLMALSQTAQQAVQSMGPIQANSREDVIDGFKSANPNLTSEQLEEIADQWEKNKDVVKDKQAGMGDSIVEDINTAAWDWTISQKDALTKLAKRASAGVKSVNSLADKVHLRKVEKQALDGVRHVVSIFGDLKTASEEHLSRFEEGKHADPTKDMSPEDAAEWKKQNEEHKDNFKSAVQKALKNA